MAAAPPGPEMVMPIGTQKHDPAWKHCVQIKANERVQLKCNYCHKLFLGGGIHRIKEHLARHKGNAAGCLQVPAEVQLAMQQSLDAVEARRKKKKSVAEESGGVHPAPGEIDAAGVLDSGAGEQDVANSSERRRRRKRVKCSPPISDASLVSISNSTSADRENHAYTAIARFLYEAGMPLDAVNSASFQPMVDAIASAGPGFRPPSYHDLRGWTLQRTIAEVHATSVQYRETWARTGCSILADEWTTQMGETLINFSAYCPEGTVFLKSVDASNIVTSADTLYELFKHVVEEAGVKNVVQVIINNRNKDTAGFYALAGKCLTETFPSVFWMPCASLCIDHILEELEGFEWIGGVITEAKSITRYIYSHGVILNMMRKYTNGRELIVPSESCFATNFTTLKRIMDLKEELIALVTSQEWMDCPYTKTYTGVAVAGSICGLSFWPLCNIAVTLTEGLVRLLRIVNGNKRPAMGYAYAGMYLVKEAIKKELSIHKFGYMPYWDIIERNWDKQILHPLLAAGFFLNPRYIHNIPEIPKEISSGMFECIERSVTDIRIQDKINKELNLYKNAAGDFGRKMAVRGRDALLPAEWWSTYGGGCPNLTRLAVRILSQTCSMRDCEQNRVPFEKSMNYLEHQRLQDLAFLQYNLRLQQRKVVKSKLFDPLSLDNIDTVSDWVKTELPSEGNEDFSWMVLNQPVTDGVLSECENDENVEISIAEFCNVVTDGAAQDLEHAHCEVEDGSLDGDYCTSRVN